MILTTKYNVGQIVYTAIVTDDYRNIDCMTCNQTGAVNGNYCPDCDASLTIYTKVGEKIIIEQIMIKGIIFTDDKIIYYGKSLHGTLYQEESVFISLEDIEILLNENDVVERKINFFSVY